MAKACSIEGCSRKYNGKGYCGMHALRIQRYGDPHRIGAWQRAESPYCSVDGCNKAHAAKGLCNRHYQQMRKGGLLTDQMVCQRCFVTFVRPTKADPSRVRYCSHECRYQQQLADYRDDVDGQKTKHQAWLRSRPDIIKANSHRRRARMKNAESRRVSDKDVRRLINRFGGLCAYCGTEPYSHLDHVVPLAKGGRHAIGNLLPACAFCNLSKHANVLSAWRYASGRDKVEA